MAGRNATQQYRPSSFERSYQPGYQFRRITLAPTFLSEQVAELNCGWLGVQSGGEDQQADDLV